MKVVRLIVFWPHFSLGCVAGLVILAMSVTGILLAFERQIKGWTDTPAVLQGPSDATPSASLDSLLAGLESAGQGSPTELVLQDSESAPVEAHFGRERTLYLNPWTAEIVGQPSQRTRAFFDGVERIHRSLGLGTRNGFGRGIVDAANLGFLFMLVSGLCLWIPRVFGAASLKGRLLLRRHLKGKARDWNWHHVIGIWTAIPLFFIILSGVIISYPWASNLLYTMTGSQPPAGGWRGEKRSPAIGSNNVAHASPPQFPARPLEDLAKVAKLQAPNWKSITIEVPRAHDRILAVSIDKSIGGQPEKTMQLLIDRQTGQLEAVRSFSSANAGSKLRAWARFLHTGEEFGIVGKSIAALACLGASVLVWTGLAMAARRTLQKIAVKRETIESSRGGCPQYAGTTDRD